MVAEQDAVWHTPGSERATAPQRVASAFPVRGGHVARAIRYPALDDAWSTAGLSRQDQISR